VDGVPVFSKNNHVRKPAAYPRGAHAAYHDAGPAFGALKLIDNGFVIKKIYCRPGAVIDASAASHALLFINLHTRFFLYYCAQLLKSE
jgi:hypothetical protein